jgi:hypothetical protein
VEAEGRPLSGGEKGGGEGLRRLVRFARGDEESATRRGVDERGQPAPDEVDRPATFPLVQCSCVAGSADLSGCPTGAAG